MKVNHVCSLGRFECAVLCVEYIANEVASFPPQRQRKDFYSLHPLTKVSLQA